jgi:hypothetical protein
MKTIVRKNCTGCHTASYPLQHRVRRSRLERGARPDEARQRARHLSGPGPDHKANPNIETHQQELAAYLARARRPGDSSMKFNLRPRPAGEAARVVVSQEYDVPLEPNTSTAVVPSGVP